MGDEELVSWLGILLFIIVVMTVYRTDLKAILFTAPTATTGGSSSSPLTQTGFPLIPIIYNPLHLPIP